MRQKHFIILLIIISLIVSPRLLVGDKQDTNVTVFIIDNEIDPGLVDGPLQKIGSDPGHGSLVTWIIRSEVEDVLIKPFSINEEITPLQSDRIRLYLDKIINYKKKNPEERVLVNISLGFNQSIGEGQIKSLDQLGVKIIAAAGNNNSSVPIYPAGAKEVVAVANAERKGKAKSSNYGDYIDIAAPGDIEYIENLYFPQQTLSRRYRFVGTSFSAPRITGVIAKMLTLSPDLTPDQALKILYDTADSMKSELFKKGKLGSGIVNKAKALKKVKSTENRGSNWNWLNWILNSLAAIFTLFILKYTWSKFNIFSLFVILLLIFFVVPLVLGLGPHLYQLFSLRELGIGSIILLTGYYLLRGLILILVSQIDNPHILLRFVYFPDNKIRDRVQKRLLDLVEETDENYSKMVDLLINLSAGIKRKSLITVLCNTEKPPLGAMLSLIYSGRTRAEFIGKQLKRDRINQEILIKRLKKFLKMESDQYRNAVRKLLAHFDNHIIINHFKEMLSTQEEDLLIYVLQLFANLDFTKQNNFNKKNREEKEEDLIDVEDIVSELRQIINTEEREMWIRYYALKAYINLAERDAEFYELIEELKDDRQELVRLEARFIIQFD